MSKEESNSSNRMNIAIDGPAGAGKSTVARRVAGKLGYVYIDTGAMYRAVTLAANRAGIDPAASDELAAIAAKSEVVLQPGANGQIVMLDGEDVTDAIRTREVTLKVSQVAAHEQVRTRLVELQRRMAAEGGVVMDGRDIGTHVLHHAELKVFLTASVQVRALRRYNELAGDQKVPLDQLEQEIAERDRSDQEREISPLICAEDAIIVDSSELNIDQVVDVILNLSRTKLAEAK